MRASGATGKLWLIQAEKGQDLIQVFIGPLWLQTERLWGSGGGVGRGGCPETSEEATAKSRLW